MGELRRARHLRRKYLQVEGPAVVLEARNVFAQYRIGAQVGARREAIHLIFMPMQLHAHPAHQRVFLEPVELRANVLRREIGVTDNGVRPADFIRRLLHPRGLVLEAHLRPVRLHIDRLLDAGARNIA